MVLVLLGTQNNSFYRLLEEIDELVEKGKINEEVVVQSGYTKYSSKNMKIIDFMSKEELDKFQEKASYIITHGGVGSIVSSLKKGKKVIAIARKHEYQEHVNNHQEEIVDLFNQKGYVIGIKRVNQLEQAVQKLEDFKPRVYQPKNTKMLKLIEDFIEQV